MSDCCYEVHQARVTPERQGLWDGAAWRAVAALDINQFHPRSSDHRPRTRAKLLYDARGLHVLYDVKDRFVRCTHQGYQEPVCRDSCVELFVEPLPGRGYFNFEVNCGGALLCHHMIDPSKRSEGGFRDFVVLPEALLKQVGIYHSLPERIEPEISDAVNWRIELAIPWGFFESVLGPVRPAGSACWRANLYKCADKTSHPHWASWSSVGEVLNFHRPQCFGTLRFAQSGSGNTKRTDVRL